MIEHLLRRAGATATRVAIHRRGRDRYKDLIDAGAPWHDTPRSLAGEATVVLLMLPDLRQVEEVLLGEDGLLAADPEDLLLGGLVDLFPDRRAPARRAPGPPDRRPRARSRRPVSGGTDGAEAGTLSIMVGGADDDARRSMTVLGACGRAYHLGPLGSGEVAKACNQLIVSAAVLALGEAAVLADRSGLELVGHTPFELFARAR